MTIANNLRQQISAAANHRCEYCKSSARLTGIPLIMEHILPRSLGGTDEPENLAAACYRCNEFKGAKTEAVDPQTQQLMPLFNPRLQEWSTHFAWKNGGTHVIGSTPVGRATVVALRLNNDDLVVARTIWIEFAWHPPND